MNRRAAQILVTLGLLALLLASVDLRELLATFVEIDWAYGVAALLLLFVQNDLTTRRWTTILRAFGDAPGYFRMLRIQYMALFAQLFLPSSIGGAAVRTGMLYRSRVALGVAINAVLIDRLVALGGLVLLALLFMPSIALKLSVGEGARPYVIAFGFGAAAAVVLVGLALLFRPFAFWWGLLKRTQMRQLLEPMERAVSNLTAPRTVLAATGYSLSGQLVAILAIYLLSQGNQIDVSLSDCVLIMPPVMLLASLPISIAGWGVREGAMVVAFGVLGVTREAALVLSLQYALVGYLSAAPGAAAWIAEPNRRALKGQTDMPDTGCT